MKSLQEWPEVGFGEIFDISSSKRVLESQWKKSGIPFYRAREIVKLSESGRVENELFIDEELYDDYKRKYGVPQVGDLMVSAVGTLGACYVVGSRDKFYFKDASVLQFRPRVRIDSRFFWHAFKTQELIDQINAWSGSTVGTLTISRAKELKIKLPPLEEQKRIASILDQADELRRKRQRSLDRLNQLGQAIFIEMFGDFTTNPLGWDTVKLGDVCGVGSSKRVFVEEFVDEGVPFYRGTEVGKLATGEAIEPDLFISPGHYAELVHHSGKPHVGDLLLPSICHDGRIWRVDNEEPFYFKDGRVLWIKKNESVLNSEYLRNHLRNAFLQSYLTIASGTTFAELKIVNLKGLSILLPPLKLQAEFSARIRKVEATRIEMVQSEKAATLLFDALQHRAFRGELTASSPKEAAA